MIRFKQFIEQDAPKMDLDQTRRILGISQDIWDKTSSKGGVYNVGNYLFPNGLWFGSVSVEVISSPISVKTKKGHTQYVKVKVLASKASNKEMVFRYRNGKPEVVNGDIGDFVTYLPLSSLVGFGLDQSIGAGIPGLTGMPPI